MAYTAWSVVFGEQPTAAKWNQLGANDAGFKDGTNIDNLAIITRHINTNAVTGDKLATNAIKLGKTQITATVGITTSYADIISVTVTVPAGGRDVLLLLSFSQAQGSAGTERAEIRIMEGSTIYQRHYSGFKNPGIGGVMGITIPAPSAGSHTYKINAKMDIGTSGLFYADATGSPLELDAFLV